MIRLTKAHKPGVLGNQADAWTREYLELLEAGDEVPDSVRYRYRHPDVKEALRTEASYKCIYCESKISHVFPGETDHLAPVSERPDLYVRWENLGYVCKECNRAKGAYYSEAEPLINPFTDETGATRQAGDSMTGTSMWSRLVALRASARTGRSSLVWTTTTTGTRSRRVNSSCRPSFLRKNGCAMSMSTVSLKRVSSNAQTAGH